jgi:sugar phosphate isomerase/epimerase
MSEARHGREPSGEAERLEPGRAGESELRTMSGEVPTAGSSDSEGRFSRRALLAGVGLLGAAAAMQKPKLLRGYLIGCYTRPWDQLELGAALDGIAEAGYFYAGLMTSKDRTPTVLTPATTEEEAGRVGEEARKRGLQICSVYGDFSARASARDGERQLKRLIDNCAACGSQELLLGGTDDAASYPVYLEVIRGLCDYALAKRVGLTIKPHGGLNATGAQCRQAIEKVGSSNFRLWYDPGNILYYSKGELDPLQDVIDVDGLVVGMSVKDFALPRNVAITPGSGRVQFPALLARLQLGGFTRGQLVVECTDRGDYQQVTQEARKARLFVERLARGHGLQDLRPGD